MSHLEFFLEVKNISDSSAPSLCVSGLMMVSTYVWNTREKTIMFVQNNSQMSISLRYGVTGRVIWMLETMVTMTNMRVRDTITLSCRYQRKYPGDRSYLETHSKVGNLEIEGEITHSQEGGLLQEGPEQMVLDVPGIITTVKY